LEGHLLQSFRLLGTVSLDKIGLSNRVTKKSEQSKKQKKPSWTKRL